MVQMVYRYEVNQPHAEIRTLSNDGKCVGITVGESRSMIGMAEDVCFEEQHG